MQASLVQAALWAAEAAFLCVRFMLHSHPNSRYKASCVTLPTKLLLILKENYQTMIVLAMSAADGIACTNPTESKFLSYTLSFLYRKTIVLTPAKKSVVLFAL